MLLYLFNPDTDLALADNHTNYMPPVSIRQMSRDLALLPLWYARPGSGIVVPSAIDEGYLKQVKQLFGCRMKMVVEDELTTCGATDIRPWGWNPSLCRQLRNREMAVEDIPGSDRLEEYRTLSGRDTYIPLLHTFQDLERYCGTASKLVSLTECEEYGRNVEACLFKTPWSGSGKGLHWCRHGWDEEASRWCRRALREQGFLVASPIYNKVEDMAMEFYIDRLGRCRFVGYSLFCTSAKGSYQGNRLMGAEQMEQWLGKRFFDTAFWSSVRREMGKRLHALLGGHYTGYVGVDMMICSDSESGEYRLHPCVEVNLRMNMGVLAVLFARHYLAPGSSGYFTIRHYATYEELKQDCAARTRKSPVTVEKGRLRKGFFPLVPVTPDTRFLAFVEIDEQVPMIS